MAGEPELGAFLDKSSLRGRWRLVGNCSGEPGSFLTIILGGPPALRELFDCNIGQHLEDGKPELVWEPDGDKVATSKPKEKDKVKTA